MKRIIVLFCLVSFAPSDIRATGNKHKSEAELAEMTPAQRVNEWANEQVYHQPSLSDHYGFVIEKYVLRDGLAGLPRVIQIVNEYDPTRASGKRGHKGERFDAMLMLLSDLVNQSRDCVALRMADARWKRSREPSIGCVQPVTARWVKSSGLNTNALIFQ